MVVFGRIIYTLLIRNAHRMMSPEITLNSYAERTQRWVIAGLCARCINCMISTRSLNIHTPPPTTEQPKAELSRSSSFVRQWSAETRNLPLH